MMKFPLSARKAFSLVEISMVIVIVAILFAGITATSVAVKKSKLANARVLTKTSPVADTAGLQLWLEPVMEESFLKNEAVDQYKITQWNDINPQSDKPYYLTKIAAPASSDIVYFRDGINSLPTIYFPVDTTTNPQLALSTAPAKAPNYPNAILTTNNAFTFFAVEETIPGESDDNGVVFYNGSMTNDGWGYSRNSQNVLVNIGATDGGATLTKSTPHIISATFGGGSSGAINLFRNGQLEALNDSTAVGASPTLSGSSAGFFIGYAVNGHAWHGKLSELIIFDHVLKVNERKAIEEYLGKKYNIALIN